MFMIAVQQVAECSELDGILIIIMLRTIVGSDRGAYFENLAMDLDIEVGIYVSSSWKEITSFLSSEVGARDSLKVTSFIALIL